MLPVCTVVPTSMESGNRWTLEVLPSSLAIAHALVIQCERSSNFLDFFYPWSLPVSLCVGTSLIFPSSEVLHHFISLCSDFLVSDEDCHGLDVHCWVSVHTVRRTAYREYSVYFVGM